MSAVKRAKADAKTAATMARTLDEYVAVTDALKRVTVSKHEFSISVSNEADDSDFLTIALNRKVAAGALQHQRKRILAKLRSLDIEVG